ncbi:acyltransferase family protein [Acinetobacter baumannii]
MPSKIIWLDYVRAIACCMVILLHTAAEYVLKSNNTDWLIANVVDSFTRVCVPLFFMISGYLFFSNKTVKIKNFIKILTALTFYSFIAFIATILFHYLQPSSPLTFYFFEKPSFYHLWYFYPLIAIYLLSLIIKIRDVSFNITLSIFLIFFILFNPQIKNYFNFFLALILKIIFLLKEIFFIMYYMVY